MSLTLWRGPAASIEAKKSICASRFCEPCFSDVILRLERWPHDSAATTLYGILFRAAAQTLLEVAADPKHLGANIGCLLVLPGTDAQRWSGVRT